MINKKLLFKNLTPEQHVFWYDIVSRSLKFEKELLNNKSFFSLENKGKSDSFKDSIQYKHNFYETVKQDFLMYSDVSNYNEENQVNQDDFNFAYLIRDWGTNEDYDQREIIVRYIEQQLDELGIQNEDSALFIGCGTGRYVVDFAARYKQLLACDKSLLMIWSIYHLIETKSWEIAYCRGFRNKKLESDIVVKDNLSISNEQIKVIKEKIDFKVSDVSDLDIVNGRFNHIYSIYFTDVLPLKTLFKEIDRLLPVNGLYIHFGPLQYFFDNIEDMYSADEVMSFFTSKGYEILKNSFLPTRHLYLKGEMKYTVYENLFFIAQKKKESPTITRDTVFAINTKVKLTKELFFSKKNPDFSMKFEGNIYSIPEEIYNLICLVDGISSVNSIFKTLDIDEEDLTVLEELFRKEILIIK